MAVVQKQPSEGQPRPPAPASGTLAEVISIILDKGIVVDAWVRVSLVGIELLTIEARVVIASVETYLKYADAIGATTTASIPRARGAVAA